MYGYIDESDYQEARMRKSAEVEAFSAGSRDAAAGTPEDTERYERDEWLAHMYRLGYYGPPKPDYTNEFEESPDDLLPF